MIKRTRKEKVNVCGGCEAEKATGHTAQETSHIAQSTIGNDTLTRQAGTYADRSSPAAGFPAAPASSLSVAASWIRRGPNGAARFGARGSAGRWQGVGAWTGGLAERPDSWRSRPSQV